MTSGKHSRRAILAVVLAGVAAVSAPALHGADQDPTAALKSKLSNSRFKDVQVRVDQNGTATLSGTVSLYEYKDDADRKARKVKGVQAVRDEIQVSSSATDSEIAKKLGPALAYSRQGYGNVFDAIQLQVQDGVVTLGGTSHDYPNRDAAIALAATTPGVKDVIDNIQVDPTSPNDNRIREQVANAIYRYPVLQKYAINPVKPIRISVQNGNVALYGSVISQQDKQLAFMRASQVPGVFSVKDYIQVEGQPAGQESENQQK